MNSYKSFDRIHELECPAIEIQQINEWSFKSYLNISSWNWNWKVHLYSPLNN